MCISYYRHDLLLRWYCCYYCNDQRVLHSHFHTSECKMSKAKMSISLPSNSHRLNLENSLRRSMKSSRDSNCCSSAHLGTHKP